MKGDGFVAEEAWGWVAEGRFWVHGGGMKELIHHITHDTELLPDEIHAAAQRLVDPAESADSKAAFLRALAQRGETPNEIAGFVMEFLALAVDPGVDRAKAPGPLLDVVGTGGDKLNLFNVSTTAMFILAGGGVCVTKHGNRGITSKSGGADVLEALGVRIDLPPEKMARGIEEIGLGFFFAPLYHPAFKAVAEARKLLASEGQRSMFNLLGPLLNPIRPEHQLVGVFDASWTAVFAEILKQLGRRCAWVVHGTAETGQGMDELSTVGPNTVWQVKGGGVAELSIDVPAHGFPTASLADLAGGDAVTNAQILEGILSGTVLGPKRDIAVLNAAAGFVITGLADDLAAGKTLAEETLDRGAAHAKLRAMQDLC
jgi:anthranilate phosphoribosyltransferase